MRQRTTEECEEQPRPAIVPELGVWEIPTWGRTEPLRKDDGTIFARLYEEQVLGVTTPEPPPQPARPDLRALVCRACGMPASPHRYAHAVEIIIPARKPKLP